MALNNISLLQEPNMLTIHQGVTKVEVLVIKFKGEEHATHFPNEVSFIQLGYKKQFSYFKAFVVLKYITIIIYKTGKSVFSNAIIAFEIKFTIFKRFININRFFYIQPPTP